MSTPDTSTDAFEAIREQALDKSLQHRVGQELHHEPATIAELADRIPEHGKNAIRPRVNELLRAGYVKRTTKRENPSGHDAYVHEVTLEGLRWLEHGGEVDPGPTLAERKGDVVRAARAYLSGDADRAILSLALDRHDRLATRMDPDP